jgi:cardiolipin synthase
MSVPAVVAPKWLCTGQEVFPAMLNAIAAAQKSIRLETYIYNDDQLGRRFRDALLAAQARGVRVSVLVDAFGSWLLPADFFAPLVAAGAAVKFFNPLRLWRFGVRDHRKLLLCDDVTAFVGGFNLADEYDGDGVTRGWCDIGVQLAGAPVAELASSFDDLFALAEFHRRPLLRLAPFKVRRRRAAAPGAQLLLSRPGRGASPIQRALHHDLSAARDVQIITAYFLPTRKLRRDLVRVVKGGGRVRLILAGKSDVLVSQLAGRSLYRRLLRAGVEIYEYQPQILHAKLFVSDRAVYVGSANLDVRSLNLNYELMLRFADESVAAEARAVFARTLKHCRRIELAGWRKSQTLWQRFHQRWAHFLVARVDQYVALRQFRSVAG